MTELKRTLFVLASPADVQISLFPPQVAVGDEMVIDFGDALDAINTAELTTKGQESLQALDQYITEHSGQHYAEHYLESDKLYTSEIWTNIRKLAHQSVIDLGFSQDKPESLKSQAIYITSPDFSNYSKEELIESLESIDREPYPERVKALETLIRAKSLRPSKDEVPPPKAVTILDKPMVLVINILGVFLIMGLGAAAGYNQLEPPTFLVCFGITWLLLSLINLTQPWVKPGHIAIYGIATIFVFSAMINAI